VRLHVGLCQLLQIPRQRRAARAPLIAADLAHDRRRLLREPCRVSTPRGDLAAFRTGHHQRATLRQCLPVDRLAGFYRLDDTRDNRFGRIGKVCGVAFLGLNDG
jgi:hypothetical protein